MMNTPRIPKVPPHSQMISPDQIVSTVDGGLDVGTWNEEPTLTQQQFADECDINNIMRKHGRDPVAFQALTRTGGVYADFSSIPDFQGMLHQVQNAQDAFASLPADMRARFRNDPAQLISFLQDERNRPEAETLGLVEKRVAPMPSNDEPNDDKGKKAEPKSTKKTE